MQLTIKQLFGEGATQTIDVLIIKKADLRGLTIFDNNRAEQLLAAIVNSAIQPFEGYLASENGLAITSETGEPIDYKNTYDFIDIFWWAPYPEKGKIVSSAILQILELYAD
jgi:hypothetical protein